MPDKKDSFHCPVCHKPVRRDVPDFPFCGERCRQIDLGRWAGGDYCIPGEPAMPWEMNTEGDD